MALIQPEGFFFAPSEIDGFLLLKNGSKAFKLGESNVECVTAPGGEKVTLSAAQTSQAESTDASSVNVMEDMVKLGDLKEASILHNLRQRFAKDEIYTKIGTILVAVNPFKIVNLYSPDILEAYAAQGGGQEEGQAQLPPHIFQIGDQAYRNVVTLNENQACLVSGESGAGKTEATKILLQFLTEMSARTASEDWGEQGRLQEQILKANPLMEAFGNAKTVRNNNSSRFGKYIEVKFNSHLGTIVGGSVTQYLLEKSRIVFQSPKERNYHIFYQLCEAAKMDPEFKQKYRLSPHADQYRYLFYPEASEGIHDGRGWEETCLAMQTLSMSPEEIDNLMRTICGVLHLGNIQFVEKKMANVEAACDIGNPAMLELVSYQLGLDGLERALCQKEVKTPNQPSVFTPYSIKQAEDVRDSLAKAVYGVVFDWLIKRINWALDAAAKSAVEGQKATHNGGGFDITSESANAAEKNKNEASIGVLDIFGFECFEMNSFEQLCINYCNEKLQGFFTEHIFNLEQQEYVKEGLSLETIVFKDNSEIIDMLERRRNGLFSMIDEEGSVPRGSDESLTSKVIKTFTGHNHFRLKNPKDLQLKFGIVHFAGEVQYTVSGFLIKNKDAVPNDVVVLLQASKYRYIRALFPSPDLVSQTKKTGYQQTTVSGGNKRSLIAQFKSQLDQLMATLSETSPHFIRCVKPNKVLKGSIFDGNMVLEQLRYAGLLEVCKIRKQGFPVRRDHSYFQWRFGVLLGKGPEAALGRQNVSGLCDILVKKQYLGALEYLVGKSKLFLKSEAFDKLERLRGLAVETSAITIQSMVRGKLCRMDAQRARQLLRDLESATAAKDVAKIEALLLTTAILPNLGRHLKQVQLAKKMMQQVEEERRVEALVVEAMVQNEINALSTAIQAAKDLHYSSPSVNRANALLSELRRQEQLLQTLQTCIGLRDLNKLTQALQAVRDVNSQSAIIPQAKALITRLTEEESLVAKMKAAIQSGHVQNLKVCIDDMVSFGMGSHALVSEALKITKEQSNAIAKFQEIVDKLKVEALEAERDIKKLVRIQQSVLELGISRGVCKEIDDALDLLLVVEKEQAMHKMLQHARKALLVKSSRTGGLTNADDLVDLRNVLKSCTISEDDEEYKETVDCLIRGERQLVCQANLQDLLTNSFKDLAKLKQGLESCKGLEMNTVDVYIKVRERILQLEELDRQGTKATPQQHQQQQNQRADVNLDDDALEKKNKEKLRNASSPGFYYGNYFRLRSDADFAKGIMFNKNKPITAKLSYQSDPVHKSLCELPADLSRQATRLNRSILGYCGDVMMSFPASLAQDLVDKCLSNSDLSDEVYLQLCKHGTLNPEPQSVGRVWQLFCICVGCFPPSQDFEPYLLNFFLKSFSKGSIIGHYARYALRRLQSTVSFGPTSESISIDEIIAYGDRPPVMATIQLIDDTSITKDFPVPPHMNVDDVLRICSEFLGLSEEHAEWFGIFVKEKPQKKQQSSSSTAQKSSGKKENVDAFFAPQLANQATSMPDELDEDLPPPPPPMEEDEDDVPPRTPYPLESTQHLGDIVLNMARSQLSETFIFKRKFFLPQNQGLTEDAIYNRLMYLQVLDEVLTGNWHCLKLELVVELSSIAFAVDLGEDMPNDTAGMLDEGLMEYIPVGWKEKMSEKEWAKLILTKRNTLVECSVEELEMLFMKTCEEELPTYGSCVFFVRRQWGGADYVAFVDYQGLRVMTLKTREVLMDIRYKQMKKFSATSRVLTFELLNGAENVMLFTSQAKEIVGLMQDYRNLLSLVPEQDLVSATSKSKSTATNKKGGLFSTNKSSPDKGPRKTEDLFTGPSTSGRDRILSVNFMKPGPSNATLEASKQLLAQGKKVF